MGVISGLLLMSISSAQASDIKWKDLSKIQKNVLNEHAHNWNNYSEAKQNKLLDQSKKVVKKLNLYKGWVYSLTDVEKKEFYKNKKEMSVKKFQEYVDRLMKKYGKPN
jgi:TRAP-type C4-dicarboxylate transport system substrate-binding protein